MLRHRAFFLLVLAIAVSAFALAPAAANADPMQFSKHVTLDAIPDGWAKNGKDEIRNASLLASVSVNEESVPKGMKQKDYLVASLSGISKAKAIAVGNRTLFGKKAIYIKFKMKAGRTVMIDTLIAYVDPATHRGYLVFVQLAASQAAAADAPAQAIVDALHR